MFQLGGYYIDMDLQRVFKELKEFRKREANGGAYGIELEMPDESNIQKLIGRIKGPEVGCLLRVNALRSRRRREEEATRWGDEERSPRVRERGAG